MRPTVQDIMFNLAMAQEDHAQRIQQNRAEALQFQQQMAQAHQQAIQQQQYAGMVERFGGTQPQGRQPLRDQVDDVLVYKP